MLFAIVTVGYNRPDSMYRLLESVKKANYGNDKVDIVISIDKGVRQSEIIEVGEKFDWTHGEKIIRAFPQRQGLRPHILQCGDLTEKYDAVIILEDDITVAEGFYDYAKQCVEFYDNDNRISGISLYKHRLNPGNRFPFDPAENEYDVYFMEMAQSWGQCWTKRMWTGFKTWYNENKGKIIADKNFPAYIAAWDNRSWMKYYNKYNVECNKYYVYPYKSLSTNHSESGEHSVASDAMFQVPLLEGTFTYRLPSFEKAIKYDIFFERREIENIIFPELKGTKLLDLQGIKTIFDDSDYLISTQVLPYRIIQSIALEYRPIEVNCIKEIKGEGIYVYNLKNTEKNKNAMINMVQFSYRGIGWRIAFYYAIKSFLRILRYKIKNKIAGLCNR